MNTSPLISVIVPVYNVRSYLHDCLESIRIQSFPDFEVVMVDDGSDDGSIDICRQFVRLDGRFRLVLHRCNNGVAVARNTGLAQAVGRYIAFVDSDDLILPNYLAVLWRLIETTGASVGCVRSFSDRLAHYRLKASVNYPIDTCTGREAAQHMLYQYGRIDVNTYLKLIDRRLFSTLRFREGICYEDLDLMPRLMVEADKVAVTAAPLYFYRRRPGSIMTTFSTVRLDVLKVTERLCRWAEREQPGLVRATIDRRLRANINIYLLSDRYSGYETDTAKQCRAVIEALRGEVACNAYSTLKSRMGALCAFGGRPALKMMSLLARMVTYRTDIRTSGKSEA